MDTLQTLQQAIEQDPANQQYTANGIKPLYSVHPEARLVIIGQAPGKKAQDTRLFWNDQSGKRLRIWLGMDEQTFYHSKQLAILPMDFYYPGKGKSGDLPPRKDFAAKWHPRCMEFMPQVKLILLLGRYAQNHYLLQPKTNLTETVRNYQTYLPTYFPLPHPSPLNGRWLQKNPWFDAQVVPALREKVKELIPTITTCE
jgi:uracil-DNA glycosylase